MKEKLQYQLVKPNFVYPLIKDEDFKFGSATEVEGNILCPDGDWRDSTPPGELQNRHGVESSACFIEAQQHTVATILEKQYKVKDQNYSARFNLNLVNASPNGGSPIEGGNSIRHDGLIPDEMLPFSEDINSWQEFRSFEGGNKAQCLVEGQHWLNKWTPKYDIVIQRNEPVATKYTKMKRALKSSPLPVSVCAWITNSTGEYIKPEGEMDNHLVELVHIDDQNCPYIWDTYEPFLKKLTPNYNFDFGLRWTVDIAPARKVWFLDLLNQVLTALKLKKN